MKHSIDTILGLIDVKGNKTEWLIDYKKSISNCSKERLIEIAASWASEAEFQQQQRLKLTKKFNSINAGLSLLPSLFNLKNKKGLLEWADEYDNHFNNPVIAKILIKAHAKSRKHQSDLNTDMAHAETNNLKMDAYKYWLENIDKNISGRQAGKLLAKQIPLKEGTLADYVTQDFKTGKMKIPTS